MRDITGPEEKNPVKEWLERLFHAAKTRKMRRFVRQFLRAIKKEEQRKPRQNGSDRASSEG
jgi:hypothetical protein